MPWLSPSSRKKGITLTVETAVASHYWTLLSKSSPASWSTGSFQHAPERVLPKTQVSFRPKCRMMTWSSWLASGKGQRSLKEHILHLHWLVQGIWYCQLWGPSKVWMPPEISHHGPSVPWWYDSKSPHWWWDIHSFWSHSWQASLHYLHQHSSSLLLLLSSSEMHSTWLTEYAFNTICMVMSSTSDSLQLLPKPPPQFSLSSSMLRMLPV